MESTVLSNHPCHVVGNQCFLLFSCLSFSFGWRLLGWLFPVCIHSFHKWLYTSTFFLNRMIICLFVHSPLKQNHVTLSLRSWQMFSRLGSDGQSVHSWTCFLMTWRISRLAGPRLHVPLEKGVRSPPHPWAKWDGDQTSHQRVRVVIRGKEVKRL